MRLYKYKKVVDDGYAYFIDMLKNEYLYCSDVSKFDDVFDGRMPFGKDKEKEELDLDYIKDVLSTECSYFDNDKHFDIDEWMRQFDKIVRTVDLSGVSAESEDGYVPDEDEVKAENKLNRLAYFFRQDSIAASFQKYILDLFEFEKKIRVCCLSNDKRNQVLWSMYGDNYQGACIEYEIDDELPQKVIYGNRDDYDPLLFLMKKVASQEEVSHDEIKAILNNLLLSKKDTWAFQKEYRIIGKEEKIPCKIVNVYFGRNLLNVYKQQIFDEFKNKYNFYNMVFDRYCQNLEFKPFDNHVFLERMRNHKLK